VKFKVAAHCIHGETRVFERPVDARDISAVMKKIEEDFEDGHCVAVTITPGDAPTPWTTKVVRPATVLN
jgi:hypothetical protein